MKVDLRIYLAKNFGDDLFLEIISSRYKNIEFIAYPILKYSKNDINSNVIMKNNIIIRKYNNFCDKFKLYGIKTNRIIAKKCDATIIVGGSIFQEEKNWHYYKKKLSLFSNLSNNYYILSCNFGPYNTNEFYNIHRGIISKAKDVCFRDQKSYNLFSDLPNVRYSSDIVFSLDTTNYKIKEEKKVVISIIDLQWRDKLNMFQNDYENKMIEIINYFVSKDYEVTLMSFSKHEGDESAIERIMNNLEKEIISKVNTYYYEGNIKEALDEIASCQIIVASRFHANILGLLFNKTIIPIIYSNKTMNLLNDINFTGKQSTIEDINNFKIDFSDDDLHYKVNVDNQIESAKHQFQELDIMLKGKENE